MYSKIDTKARFLYWSDLTMTMPYKKQTGLPTPRRQALKIFCASTALLFLLGSYLYSLSFPWFFFCIGSAITYFKIKSWSSGKCDKALLAASICWLFFSMDYYSIRAMWSFGILSAWLLFVLLEVFLYKYYTADVALVSVVLVSYAYIFSLLRGLVGVLIVTGGFLVAAIIIFRKYAPALHSKKISYESFRNNMLLPLIFLQCVAGARGFLKIAEHEIRYAENAHLYFYPILSMWSAFLWNLLLYYVFRVCTGFKNITDIYIANERRNVTTSSTA